MKIKTLISSIFCLIGLFVITGCNNTTGNNNPASSSKDENNHNNISQINEIKCDTLDNVMITTNEGFMTNDNDVYYVIYDKLKYEQNCIKVNNVKIKTFFKNEAFLGEDGNVYSYNGKEKMYKTDLFNPPNIIKKSKDIVKHTYNNNNDGGYFLKTDGIIYDSNNNIVKSFDNERIIDFGVDLLYKINYIKTDKAYYISIATNKNECEEYADVECNYELKMNDYMTDNYDDIAYISDIYYSGIEFVKKDGKIMLYNFE